MTLKEAAQILELTPPFSREDLKKAFRDALMVWHPDRFPEGTERRAKAEKRTQQVNDAYDLLSRLPDSDFPIRGEGWTESTAAASPPKRTEKEPSGMSSKRFSILIAAGILCALLFSAPGLYRLSMDYEKDKAQEWQRISKNVTWQDIINKPGWSDLDIDTKYEVRRQWLSEDVAPALANNPDRDAILEVLANEPLDTGEGALRSAVSSFARGALHPLSEVLIAVGALIGSEGIEQIGKGIQGSVESMLPVNPVLVAKWPMKLAFWLGFVASPAAFFVIRARRKGKRADDGG